MKMKKNILFIFLCLFILKVSDVKSQTLNGFINDAKALRDAAKAAKEAAKAAKDAAKAAKDLVGKPEETKNEKPKSKNTAKKEKNKHQEYDFDLSGKWIGKCRRGTVYDFDFSLDLKQNDKQISGTAELLSAENTIKYLVSGKVEGNIFTLIEDSVIESLGTDGYFKFDFSGKISLIKNILNIKGKGVNTNFLYFDSSKVIKLRNGITDAPFEISKVDEIAAAEKAKKECISGDCLNGFSIKINEFGKYEGEFKNGKANGKGKYDFYSGFYKGHRYIGEFVNNAFQGFGTQYLLVDLETSKGDNYKANISFIKGAENEIMYKEYEGNWVHNYPSGLGKMFKKGLPQIGIWNGWHLSERQALSYSQLQKHLDSTFAIFKKCNCLSPSKITVYAMGLGSVRYDVFDSENGKKIREESELETMDKSFNTNGFKNETNKIIYIKCYRKLHNVYTNKDEYRDESYAVSINQEIYKSYRHLPEAGDVIAQKEKEEFVFLGQFCLKNDVSPCNVTAKKNKN
jgi:hypothetical protein